MKKLDKWINKPEIYSIEENRIMLKPLAKTDFWQVTHYGFSRTDGNCYVTDVEDDVCFTVKVKMSYIAEFDQCGVIVYGNEENFAKLCVENQLHSNNKLGSVVTKSKRSDWATQAFDNSDIIYYRISKRGINYLFEYSIDGEIFEQMRLFDIPECKKVSIGVFGASPLGEGFVAEFMEMNFSENKWTLDMNDIPEEMQ
jgi:regulation of enolase protein 1 (concanavalin A-like superfamily)